MPTRAPKLGPAEYGSLICLSGQDRAAFLNHISTAYINKQCTAKTYSLALEGFDRCEKAISDPVAFLATKLKILAAKDK